MRGLRTQEDKKFIKFFSMVQDAAKEKNCVFFGNSGEGNEIITPEFEGEDLFGWLIPEEMADEFEKEFMAFHVSTKWEQFYMFANWYRDQDNQGIRIVFEE